MLDSCFVAGNSCGVADLGSAGLQVVRSIRVAWTTHSRYPRPNPSVGRFSSSGHQSPAAPAGGAVNYTLDALAFAPNSAGQPDHSLASVRQLDDDGGGTAASAGNPHVALAHRLSRVLGAANRAGRVEFALRGSVDGVIRSLRASRSVARCLHLACHANG
jgi:hypothetical protein